MAQHDIDVNYEKIPWPFRVVFTVFCAIGAIFCPLDALVFERGNDSLQLAVVKAIFSVLCLALMVYVVNRRYHVEPW